LCPYINLRYSTGGRRKGREGKVIWTFSFQIIMGIDLKRTERGGRGQSWEKKEMFGGKLKITILKPAQGHGGPEGGKGGRLTFVGVVGSRRGGR